MIMNFKKQFENFSALSQHILILVAYLCLPQLIFAQELVSLSADPASWVRLEGDSTLHPYHSTATVFLADGTLEVPSHKSYIDGLMSGGLKDLNVLISVAGLKSGKKGLDKNMQEALKSEDHPSINFQLIDYEVVPSTQVPPIQIKTRGTLEVAGVKQEINITANVSAVDQGIRFTGGKALLMSEYDIKPPKMFLGTIKTADEIQIIFDFVLKKINK